MKSILITLTILAASVSQAAVITCGGSIYSHSPYPGAGGSSSVFLMLNEDTADGRFRLQYNGDYSIKINNFKHDMKNAKYSFSGLDQAGKKIRGQINYLTEDGVVASVKVAGTKSVIKYVCQSFRVKN